ncbi:transposase [Oscillatoria sp. FACHB-1406]|uniref:REP-associated tyrosine transposase n=1 Tax=Oscillatoria sp. FACHB-1406 TaxID=2692846 RepID=UPI00168445AB|nr:transposase [Oscillatoria sp. FACHB-1406]MBD2577374.1 transposase [Oscillatoria sp. FACHB-1406]
MPNYRRITRTGGTYFFTQVTYQRYPWLCSDLGRSTLRASIEKVREKYPFLIDSFVLLPDHFHCILTLPEGDSDYKTRLRLIKTFTTKNFKEEFNVELKTTTSRQKRQERNLWQRRYWEHAIRDEEDFARHCDYIHYNPVKHGLCTTPQHWRFSSIHRFITSGIYPKDWGCEFIPDIPMNVRYE